MSDQILPPAGDGASNAANGPAENGPTQNGQAGQAQPSLVINAQYVKDLSFENPAAPRSLSAGQAPPQVGVDIDVQATGVSQDMFEVVLTVRGQASRNNEAVFLVELSYAGLFTVKGLAEEQLRPVLLIEAPRLLFPFARAIIADATREGGYPPLLINPVDFVELYRRSLAQQQPGAAAS